MASLHMHYRTANAAVSSSHESGPLPIASLPGVAAFVIGDHAVISELPAEKTA